MLIVTGIISQVKSCLDQVPKWSPMPLTFPYSLQFVQSHHGSQNNSLKFVVSVKYANTDWFWHMVIQATIVISLLYQVALEDNLKMEICVHLFIGLGAFVGTIFSYIQHVESKEIAKFLNELLTFEKRWLHNVSTEVHKYWRNVEYRRFVLLSLRLFRITLPLVSMTIASSVAILPYSPWRILPAAVLNGVSRLADGESLISEVNRRAASFIFTYLSVHLCVNHYITVASITFFSAQCSIFWMILAFKKLLAANSLFEFDPATENVDTIVRMFREIQIFSGLFNDTHKLIIFPAIIIVSIVNMTVSTFVLVSAWGSLDLQAVLIFGNLVFTGSRSCLAAISPCAENL